MKSPSRQCPNGHGAMHRCHIKITKVKVQSWHVIPWQYCPFCKIMLPVDHNPVARVTTKDPETV